MELTNKEKLNLFVKQLIEKGLNRIDELSIFKEKLTQEQIDAINNFQLDQKKKIESCKTAIVILYHPKFDDVHTKRLNELLENYEKRVINFPFNFPI